MTENNTHELSPSEFREYHSIALRDCGSETEINIQCCPFYQSFDQVLMPSSIPHTDRNLALFIVKIPPVKKKMKLHWFRYQELMRQRVQLMICRWMEQTGEDKSQTYQRLKKTLHRLNPSATPPRLTSYPGWEWASSWGDCLIQEEQTWTHLFQENAAGTEFPLEIPQEDSASPELLKVHEQIHLDQFLAELTNT